jgi:hypothetical protein
MGLIACQYRAAEWRHKEVELAAHELLQYLDNSGADQRRAVQTRGASDPDRPLRTTSQVLEAALGP